MDGTSVTVPVTNTGDRPSREVVQVYLDPTVDDEPVRLVGWDAVSLAVGESARVEVTADPRLLRRWDTAANGWGDPITSGELLIARGLGDIRARLTWG